MTVASSGPYPPTPRTPPPGTQLKYRSARTPIIAHAGGDYFGPPNTIEMMRAAKAAGADILDTDIRTTSDGIIVAAHDDTIRTASGAVVSIANTTYAELRQIDLGDTWNGPAHDHPLAGHNVHVPSLDDVLRTFPRERVGIELKTTGDEARLCALLRTRHRTGSVFVSSGSDGPVTRFKALCPEAVTTVTDAMEAQYLHAEATHAPWCSPVSIGQPPLAFRDFRLTKDEVAWDHAHGLADYTWTADTRAQLQAVDKLGVDAVYTDRPDIAKSVFAHIDAAGVPKRMR